MEVSVWPGLWGRSSKSEAPRVKTFQAVHPFFNVTNCIAARCVSIHVKEPILILLRHLLKRFQAMFGLRGVFAVFYKHDGYRAQLGNLFGDSTEDESVGKLFPIGAHDNQINAFRISIA